MSRPRKPIPRSLAECTSVRDVARFTGLDRRFLAQGKLLASIPQDEFDRLVADGATVRQLELLARGRAKKRTEYTRVCPHCGRPLRVEGAR